MVDEFVIQKDLLVNGDGSFGSRQAGEAIGNDLEVVNSAASVSLGIIANDAQSSILNFGDTVNEAAQIVFDHTIDQMQIKTAGILRLSVDVTGTVIAGNLTVNGTTTTVDSANLTITDNVILLNKDEVGAGVTLNVAGIEIERGSLDNAGWYYNETEDWWGPTGPSGTFGVGIGATQTIGNIAVIDATDANNILDISANGAIIVPRGTTGQQPSSPINGMFRYNSPDNTFEGRVNSNWEAFGTFTPGGGFLEITGGTISGDVTFASGAQIFGHNLNSPTTPAFSFDGDSNTGIFRSAADTIDFSAGGVVKFQIGVAEIDVSSNLDMNNNLILNPGDPTLGNHVGDRDFNDARYINVTGDIMTGTLTTQDILPDGDNTRNIGSGGAKYNTIFATTFNGTATAALYADLAERYTVDGPVEPGDVVVFGGEAEITLTTISKDTAVAGIISTEPALMMNSDAGPDMTHPYVALKGKVPCKVVGPIKKGDLIVTATLKGHGKSSGKCAPAYTAFARALENFGGGTGVIFVSII